MSGSLLQIFRAVLRAPLYALACLAILGLAVGLTVGVFSVAHSTLLQPLAVDDEDSVFALRYQTREEGPSNQGASPLEVAEWRHTLTSLEGISGYTLSELNVTLADGTRRLAGGTVTEGFFEMLGIASIAGRLFEQTEYLPGGKRAVLLRDAFWRTNFGDRPFSGHLLKISGVTFEVVGLLPADIPVGNAADVWLPLAVDTATIHRSQRFLTVLGRLREGVSFKALQAEVSTLGQRLAVDHPAANADRVLTVQPLRDLLTGELRPTLLALCAAAGLVFLQGLSSFVFLVAVRSERRRSELAVRSVLGARRATLGLLLVGEVVLLALGGGILGWGIAATGIQLFLKLSLGRLAALPPAGITRFYILALVMLAALVASMVAVFRLPSGRPGEALTGETDRRVSSRLRVQRRFVLLEVALALALLINAGLMLRSVRALLNVDVGFALDPVLAASIVFPSGEYPPGSPRIAAFLDQAVHAAEALPGATRAASTILRPLAGTIEGEFTIAGAGEARRVVRLHQRPVSPGYFATLGLAVVRGRSFGQGAAREVVVNEAAVKQIFGGVDPTGRWLVEGSEADGLQMEIVGVARSEMATLATPAVPTVYTLHDNTLWPFATVLLRTSNEPTLLVEPLRRAIQSLDLEVAVFAVEPLVETAAQSIARERTMAALLVIFATTALVLAVAGVYGIFSLMVANRRREWGIRQCLGASDARVFSGIMSWGLRLSVTGSAIGLVISWQLSRLLCAQLVGVKSMDLSTILGALALVLGSSSCACYWPARQASRVDPAAMLRLQ